MDHGSLYRVSPRRRIAKITQTLTQTDRSIGRTPMKTIEQTTGPCVSASVRLWPLHLKPSRWLSTVRPRSESDCMSTLHDEIFTELLGYLYG